MHLAIDASRCTVARITGTEVYARELIQHIITLNDALAQPHRITLYFRDTPSPTLFTHSQHVNVQVIPFRRAWTHVRFAYEITRTHPDITFVPAHTLPFAFLGQAVVTVHDLGYRLFPQAHPFSQRAYLELTTRYSAMRAKLIFADSLATKADLTRFYGTASEKIQVIYPAITAPIVNNIDVRHKYQLPTRYFVFIGTLQPRKNIAGLVQAFRHFRQTSASDIGLVLAGGKGWLFDKTWVKGVEGVYLTGYIDESDKGALLTQSIGLVFPSLYEGFGFPILEAMACDTPVICSNTSSLPELAGEACLLVNPLDIEDIAAAMTRLSQDESLRQDLIKRGRTQYPKFNWQTSAQQALQALTTS
jgi:glycosyltransferase involved in cell wall biosynthesis